MAFLDGEIARAQAAIGAAEGRRDAARAALETAQAALEDAGQALAERRAALAQQLAARDAVAAQATAAATQAAQANADADAAEDRRGQAQAALDERLTEEPERPEGAGDKPPPAAALAAWRRAHKAWEDSLPPLRQAVADAAGAVAAARQRAAELTQQRDALSAQLAPLSAAADAAAAAVAETERLLGDLQARLPALQQELDAAASVLAPGLAGVEQLRALAMALERDPFDRGELEQVAEELGARLRPLQQARAAAAAQLAQAQAQAQALREQEASVRAGQAAAEAALPGLQAEAAASATRASDAQTAYTAAENAVAAAAAAIRLHKLHRPKRRPLRSRRPDGSAERDNNGGDGGNGGDLFDEGAIEAWEEQLDALAAAHADAIAALASARLARDAANDARDAAVRAREETAATIAQLAAQATQLAAAATGAEQAAAGAQATIDDLDPRVAELRRARETATARLLGGVATGKRLVLAPVRLETRLRRDAAGDTLLIRIYPDDWHVDAHEPALTEDERSWGAHYHAQTAAAADDAARRDAWVQLADRFGVQRAAWVARATDPAAPLDVGDREGSWTRAPRSALLPERWVAIATGRDGEHAFTAWSKPVAHDPLTVGPAPAEDPLGDPEGAWLTGFQAAVDAGMALRVPLAAQHANGLARLIVLGVRAELSDEASSGRLAAGLDAHHYTGGLGVLAPGTPSNTTASGAGGYTRADPDGTRGFVTERGAPLISADDGSDGALVAAALGIDASHLAHVAGADSRARARARAMQSALWPILDGALRQALGDAAGPEPLTWSLPVLRVGVQPYGLLPATSLERWVPAAGDHAALGERLRALLASWRAAVAAVPRATPGAPLDALLAQHAYSARFTVPGDDGGPALVVTPRVQVGGEDRDGPLTPDYVTLLRDADRAAIESETFPAWPDAESGPRPHPLLYLLLRAAVLDRAAGDRARAALSTLAGADAGQLRAALLEALDSASHRLDAWVTSLAATRLGALAKGAVRIGAYGWLEQLAPAAAPTPAGEPGLVERAGNHGHLLAPSLNHASTAAVLRSGYVAHRDDPGSPLAIDLSSRRVAIAERILRGVQHGQPLAALLGYRFERLLADAGLQARLAPLRTLAGLRGEDELERARSAVVTLEHQVATLAVAYGELAARAADAATALAGATQERQRVEGVRDGYDDELAALNRLLDAAATADAALASANARLSAHLAARPKPIVFNSGELDNHGKPIKDIQEVDPDVLAAWQDRLGTLQDERRAAAAQATAAHLASDPTATRRAELPPVIAALNAAENPAGVPAAVAAEQRASSTASTTAGEAARTEGELRGAEAALGTARETFAGLLDEHWAVASESVAASNVVDGLELHRRYRAGRAEARWDATTIPFGDAGLGFGADAQAQLTPALEDLADAVDAVGDLIVAESVHQFVLGNPLRSGASLDAVAHGEQPPPELEVIRTPRRGIGVTHRVLVVLDGAASTPAWGTDADSPRAAAQPRLNAWVSRLLPDPARVRCRVELRTPDDGRLLAVSELSADALGLAPLDVAALAGRSGPGRLSELEQRLAAHAVMTRAAGVPADAQPRIVAERDPGWPASVLAVADLQQALEAVGRLLSQARALDARDVGDTSDGVDTGELERLAAAAEQALADAEAGLDSDDLDALRAALLRAAGFGVAGALPASPAGEGAAEREVLTAQASSVRTELAARLARSRAAASARERMAAIFGDDFLVLGRFTAPGLPELLAADAGRLGGGEPVDLVGWLQRITHVRDGARRLSDALAAAELLEAGDRLALRVGQLPLRADDRWVGVAPTDAFPVEAGRVSVVAHVPRDATVSEQASGLLVEEWVEVLPATTEIGGVTFHFDQPNARPPQAILLAAAPDLGAAAWDLDTLEAVVRETWELAQTRVVDPGRLRAQDAALTGVLLPDTIAVDRAAEAAGVRE